MFAMVPAPIAQGQGGGADFTRFVGVGDSLTAGFKDGALFEEGQLGGFYARLATSMGTQVVIPTIAYPGIPTPNAATGSGLLLQVPGTCQVGAVTFATGQTTGRLRPDLPATNVGVPGQNIGEALNTKWSIDIANIPGTADTAEDFVLGFPYVLAPAPLNTPRSQIETAVGLQPTFVSFWLGSNDALGAALAATVDDTTLTPVAAFETSAEAAFAAIAGTGAKAIVTNVPDVTVIPNLFSVPELQALFAAQGTNLTPAQIKLLFGVAKKDYVPLSALPTIIAIAGGSVPGPLPANLILKNKEVKKIRKNIVAYNRILKRLADANGYAFYDINARFTAIARDGYVVAGVGTLSNAYLGGLFGLDGVHPSATGHAVLATEMIAAINAKYGTTLAPPNLAAIAAADPQVCMIGSAKPVTIDDVAKNAPAARAAELVILGSRARSN
jgi:lysophospholipase L1-like esterase